MTAPAESTPLASADVEIFFDGGCPLCRREMAWLQRRDRHHHVRFTDISSPGFQAVGRTHDQLMARIHGRLPTGDYIEGVDVFRLAYAAAGFPHLVRVSRWPGIRSLLDWGYTLFARNRLRWTGRCHAAACSRTYATTERG